MSWNRNNNAPKVLPTKWLWSRSSIGVALSREPSRDDPLGQVLTLKFSGDAAGVFGVRVDYNLIQDLRVLVDDIEKIYNEV